ncbi:unnamed protein product [Alopecurus aequalis]
MAADGHDRLSELPDDLLRRILHFAPLKEAASTTALSRRWRATPLLWLSSGAVNLETGVARYYHTSRHGHDDNIRFLTGRDAFVTAAAGALGAVDGPVTRLTLLRRDKDDDVVLRTDLVDLVLSHRAARRVEELRLVVKDPGCSYLYGGGRAGLYKVTLDSLPLETLRILELTNCKGIFLCQTQHDAAVLLPRLSYLRLSHSIQQLSSLQRVIDMAPVLAAVRLESVLIDATDEEAKQGTTRRCRLRCPTANVLVLDGCTWQEKHRHPNGHQSKKTVDVDEIIAPRLRHFRYKGPLRSFSFSPQPLELEQVDLHFFGHGDEWNSKDPNRDLEIFWRFAQNFTSTREMGLRMNHLEDIAVLNEARRVELLAAFRRLERLELQGVHWTKGKSAAVTTILNLLRCCPVLCALRINLTTKQEDTSNKKGVVQTRTPQKEIQIAAMLGPRHLFPCLQSSLRGVALQFRLEKSDYLGVKLIKFFAENAMALKEMCIDGGEAKLFEHLNPKTEKWNSKRKKLGATSFVVLPLNGRFYDLN